MFSKVFRGVLISWLLCTSHLSSARLMSFDLEWSGISFNNEASATGRIVIDDTKFNNGGPNYGLAWVNDFSVTVTGATTGNGTFGLADFDGFILWSIWQELDLTTELVGQLDFNWGTCQLGACGDFNIFRVAGSDAPTGTSQNLLTPYLSSDNMQLISFRPSIVSEPSSWPLLCLALLCIFGFAVSSRKS